MNRKLKLTCAILAVAPLAWPMAAVWAQNPQGGVQGFRLEPGEPAPPSGVQGPVDADAPIRRPTPDPTSTPTTAPPPTVVVPPPTSAPTVAAPIVRPTTAVPATAAPASQLSPRATAAPIGLPAAAPTATASPPALPDLAPPVPAMDSTPAPIEAERVIAEQTSAIPVWVWLAAVIAALLAGVAWFLLRRRQPNLPVRLEAAPHPQPRPQPEPPEALPEPPLPAPVAPPPAGLSLQLTSRRLSASLFMATLQYRIELENTGAESLGPIAIAGDMTAAHASRNPQEQLAAIGQDLVEMHRVEELQSGQRTELTGEIRVPLSSITPIRQGRALLFVPLVRIYAMDASVGGPIGTIVGGGTFVIGEPPTTPGGRLRPFRLDLGPRVYPTVEQRKLTMPDPMPLDGRAMAG